MQSNGFSTQHSDKIAAVIVEPIAANMGVVPPEAGFLPGLRDITQSNGALLIFDEVITGFRMHYGGAQNLFGIEAGPDDFRQNYWRRIAGGGVRRPRAN